MWHSAQCVTHNNGSMFPTGCGTHLRFEFQNCVKIKKGVLFFFDLCIIRGQDGCLGGWCDH